MNKELNMTNEDLKAELNEFLKTVGNNKVDKIGANIKLNNLSKKYEGNAEYTLENINLEIKSGNFCVFLGPSGCGKTTLLRMIAGLNSITKGDLLFDGKKFNNLSPSERDIAMVFQSYALYPHMNVYKNMSFGLTLAKERKDIIDHRVKDAAKILKIEKHLYNKPADLSGGQRQRVAIGRAIVRKPSVFLMDEPLSNLDAKLRESMRREIVDLHRMLNTTSIYVTHDQLEAMTMADQIVVFNDGKIQQNGSPRELYFKPANLFVAQFIGSPTMNIFDGSFDGKNIILPELGISTKPTESQLKLLKNDQKLKLGIRTENIEISNLKKDGFIKLKIYNVEVLGKEQLVTFTLNTGFLYVTTGNEVFYEYGNDAYVKIHDKHLHVFDLETTLRVE